MLLEAMQHIGAVFTETFGGGKDRLKFQPSEDLCTEADDAWAALHATSKTNSVCWQTRIFFWRWLSSVIVPRVLSRAS